VRNLIKNLKKEISYSILIALLFSSLTCAQELQIPQEAHLGEIFYLQLSAAAEPGDQVEIELPTSFELTDWNAANYTYTNLLYTSNATRHSWYFKKEGFVTISCKILPNAMGEFNITLYTKSANISKTINISEQVKSYCGNLICEKDENMFTCPNDCMRECDLPCQISILFFIFIILALGFGLRKIRIRRPISLRESSE